MAYHYKTYSDSSFNPDGSGHPSDWCERCKAEGLAVLDHEQLFVAYENDRHLGLGSVDERDERHACEAPYTLLCVS